MEQVRTNLERVYQDAILNHKDVPQQYRHDFNHFMEKDYEGKNFGFEKRILEMQGLDMDEMEVSLSGDNDNTMDLVVGIARFDETNRSYSNIRFLPIELKLGCSSFNGISKTQLLKKDKHTRNMLSNFLIDKHSIFIFTRNVASQAKSNKSRWEREPNSSIIEDWEMLSPEDYNEYIGFEDDFPYRPITNLIEIGETLIALIEKKDYDGCIDYIERERKIAEEFKNKYKLNECQAISVELNNHINILLKKDIPTDYYEYFCMLKEEIKALNNF